MTKAKVIHADLFNVMTHDDPEMEEYEDKESKIGTIERVLEPDPFVAESGKRYMVSFNDNNDQTYLFFEEEVEIMSELEYKIRDILGEYQE